jgi:hypothetical protein
MFVVANADLRRIRASDFRKFHAKPINEGFPPPWEGNLLKSYKNLVARGVFYPGLHGYTHFNVQGLMQKLNEQSESGKHARTLVDNDIPYLASVTPEYNFALLYRSKGGEEFLSANEQKTWLEKGIKLFQKAFGHAPVTFCAPGYRANDTTFRTAANLGIKVFQTAGGGTPKEDKRQLTLPRNVHFEPLLFPDESMDVQLKQAAKAVAAGLPIVICSHSINYISRFNKGRQISLDKLSELLSTLLQQYPDLRFSNDKELSEAYRERNLDWFRRPKFAQVLNRLRRSSCGL